jgi:4'-phosphopantetheinyl transferase
MLERRMTQPSETGSQGNLSAPLQLCYAWPADLIDPAVEQACAALLNDAERTRAARFRFDRHRREYLAAHALTRTALSRAHPLPPGEWSYSINGYGKPTPIPECGLRFNQSHSLELVVCLLARAGAGPEIAPEVGVDVEAHTRADQIVPLAPRVFSAAEQAQLNALSVADRLDRALSLWTLKEAYIKARGMGLSLPLTGISFLFGPAQEIHLETDAAVDSNPARWSFCLLDHSRHRTALVVDHAIARTIVAPPLAPAAENHAVPLRPTLEIFEARPPFAAPTRLPSGSETWLPTVAPASQSHAMG